MAGTIIIDYGMGNLFSIVRALELLGEKPVLSADPRDLKEASRAILPGVGAFGEAIRELRQSGLFESILDFARSGRPLMGICLGMQLLMSQSSEFGHHVGLGLVPGKVERLHDPLPQGPHFKVPQMGWNQCLLPAHAVRQGISRLGYWRNSVLEGLSPGPYFYFVHSFVCVPDDPSWILAETQYGNDLFCSVLRKDNLMGCQFHPERSAGQGLKVYENFLAIS